MSSRRRALLGLAIAIGLLAVFALGAALAPDPLLTTTPAPAPPLDTQWHDPAPDITAPQTEGGGGTASGVAGAVFTALWVIALLGIGLLLVIAGIRVARAVAARPADPPEPADVVVRDVVDAERIAAVVQHAAAQIAVDDDANLVVVRCWEALERIATDAGIPRRPSETASEYVLDLLAALDVPAAPARRLAALHAEALFSAERLPPSAVADARAALTALESALSASRVRT